MDEPHGEPIQPLPASARQPLGGPASLVVNTQARIGERRFADARRELAARGVHLDAAHPITTPEQLPEVVLYAVEQGAKLVIVGGGDGTVSAVANVLAGRDVTLGVLPMGTGNDFARSLGIPLTLADACDVIASGVPAEVDLGQIGQRFFINAASIGVTTAMARRMRMRPKMKKRLGPLAYPAAAAGEVLSSQPFRAVLTTDGERHEIETLQVVVGNGRFHGAGRVVAPDAGLQEGVLDVYAILAGAAANGAGEELERTPVRDILALARVAQLLRDGSHVHHPRVLHVRARAVELQADPRQEIDVDGEVFGETPASFRCVPRAMRVLVSPPPAHDA